MVVSAKILIDLVNFLTAEGLDAQVVLNGDSPSDSVTPEELQNSDGMISWSKVASCYSRASSILESQDRLQKLAAFLISSSSQLMMPSVRIVSSISSLPLLYEAYINILAVRHFPATRIVCDVSLEKYRINISAPENGPSSETIFRILCHILQIAPLTLGLREARVEAEIGARQAMFVVTPPQKIGIIRYIKRVIIATFSINRIIKDMIQIEATLLKNQAELMIESSVLAKKLIEQNKLVSDVSDSLRLVVARFNEIEQISDTGSWTYHQDSKIISLSANAAKILQIGLAETQLNLLQLVEAIHPEDQREYKIAMSRVSSKTPDFQFEHRIMLGKQIRVLQQKGRLILDGDRAMIIGSIADATDLRKNESRLNEDRESALEASHNKSQFLASMSHEIRTPMTSVLGFAELLKNPQTPPEKIAPYIETILRNGKFLIHLLDDILDLSKVEAGFMRFNFSNIDTKETLIEILENIKSQAEKKFIRIEISFSDDVPPTLITDPVRFSQVLNNILGNAIKFTNEGVIQINVRKIRRANVVDCDGIDVEVTDSGNGISPEFSQLLFRPYSAFDMRKQKRQPGTGLGLALAKALAKAMGGDIQLLSSSKETGSTFCISLSSMKDEHQLGTQNVEEFTIPINFLAEGPLLKNKKILITEDNKDIQEILAKIVLGNGALVDIANDGIECLKKVSTTEYDIILMDLQMPVMDGFEAIKRLRDTGFNKPIIAVTAYALNNERERCIKIGCSDFITKPVNADLLVKTLVRHRGL